jgi:predicted permease
VSAATRPPRWATALLERLVPHPAREEILGDLGEELQRSNGGAGARTRYAAAACAIAARLLAARLTDGLGGDVGIALRMLRKDPGFTAVAVIALALGVGVSGMIFAVADDVLLSPLPYPAADRLANLTNDHTGSTTGDFGVSWPNMQHVAAANRSLERFALYLDWQDLTLAGPDGALRVPAAFVDQTYFDVLGLQAAHGRLLRADENRVGEAAAVALLSQGAWRRIWGADPGVIGRVMRLNGRPYEIVGVLADDRGDMRYRWGADPAGIFLPLFAIEELVGFDIDGNRGLRALNALLVWRDGMQVAAVRDDFARLSAELAREHPADNEGWSYNVQPLDEAFFEALQGPTRILLAGALLVFVLVGVNLISLVLIRTAGRRPEIAVRRAIGARPARLVRQFVTESLVLGALGGGLGLLIAGWGSAALASSGMLALPRFADVRLEVWIVAWMAAGTLAASLALGMAAAAAGRGGALAAGERASESRAGARVRTTLVTAEVALAFTLLVGAGLVLASFWELRTADAGFDADDLLVARVDLRGDGYEAERLRAVAGELMERGGSLPGVRRAFIWSPNRLGHGNQVEILTAEGRYADFPAERLEASLHSVHPGTLAQLGIALRAGRDVSASDRAGAPRVALVSERLAADLWPGEDAVGKRFDAVHEGEPIRVQVIGVTADALHRTRLIDPFGPQRDVYYPFAQAPWRSMTLALRLQPAADPGALATAVRALVRDIDAELPVYGVALMADNLRAEESSARLAAALVLLYAGLSVALAALGLYGMLAHSVRARRREIGVRLALGADAGTVLAGTLRSGLLPVLAGGLIGLATSALAARLLVGALYGVSAFDARIYAAVPALLAAVACAALWLPARRASRTDPVEVLRPD